MAVHHRAEPVAEFLAGCGGEAGRRVEATQLDPVQIQMGQMQGEQEQPQHQEAEQQGAVALDLDPGLNQSRYYLGKIYLSNGDNASALAQFKLYLKEDADSEHRDEVNEIIATLNEK